ncbi:hypothetical protein CW740_10310 [Kangiella profundi]|uniref:Uncharacterized protein n=1 Tax=Kangiella profundi TaxID=1561924 RepID=A0A2K9AT61_9GAMM|nr:hypothetical protein CW740_10310 [Kangiella profundi]
MLDAANRKPVAKKGCTQGVFLLTMYPLFYLPLRATIALFPRYQSAESDQVIEWHNDKRLFA